MAIFHLSVKCFSRSAGHSAVAAAAYRSGTCLVDARTGEICDYSRRSGVVHAALVLPASAPAWDRQMLWDRAEAAENRKNSTVARECEIALPTELPRKAQIELSEGFATWLSARYGIAVDVDVHEPTKDNDKRNVHAHLQCTTRQLGADGFGAKTRVLDAAATGSAEIQAWREAWADQVNATLERHGIEARIDHRSHADRGLVEVPTIKEGRSAGGGARRSFNVEARAVNEGLRQAIQERAQAAAVEKIAQARALVERHTQALADLKRLPLARVELSRQIDSLAKQRLELKKQRDRALPNELVEQGRAAFEYKNKLVTVARIQLGELQAQLEQRQRWWHWFTKRDLEHQIERIAVHLPRWEQECLEERATARAPVIEDVDDQDRALRQVLAQRLAQREALDQVVDRAQVVLVDAGQPWSQVPEGKPHRGSRSRH